MKHVPFRSLAPAGSRILKPLDQGARPLTVTFSCPECASFSVGHLQGCRWHRAFFQLHLPPQNSGRCSSEIAAYRSLACSCAAYHQQSTKLLASGRRHLQGHMPDFGIAAVEAGSWRVAYRDVFLIQKPFEPEGLGKATFRSEVKGLSSQQSDHAPQPKVRPWHRFSAASTALGMSKVQFPGPES